MSVAAAPLNRSATRLMIVIFFFQAEDGIRDLTVTGVQTCALPISPHPRDLRRRRARRARLLPGGRGNCLGVRVHRRHLSRPVRRRVPDRHGGQRGAETGAPPPGPPRGGTPRRFPLRGPPPGRPPPAPPRPPGRGGRATP